MPQPQYDRSGSIDAAARVRRKNRRITTTKNDLARQVSETAGISIRVAEIAIDAMLQGITTAVAAGNRVELRNFGIFMRKRESAHQGCNQLTGRAYSVPATAKLGFKTSRYLRKLNGE